MRSLLLAGAMSVMASGAFAAVVDFEGLLVTDPTDLGTSYSVDIITFTSTENMQLVGVGLPDDDDNDEDGFVPNDQPDPDVFGEVFITGDFVDDTNMTLTFDVAVDNLIFDIADIDGGNDSSNPGGGIDEPGTPNDREFFTLVAKLGGVEVLTVEIDSSDVAGDAKVVTFNQFAGVTLDQLLITGETDGGTRNIGWGLDNINYTPVPLPAGAVLILTALGGLGAVRMARRKA